MNETFAPTLLAVLLLLGATALVHAAMQLGVSVLTLLSGHSLGLKKAHTRLLMLNFAYILGSLVATFLVLSAGSQLVGMLLGIVSVRDLQVATCVLALLSSLGILRFYYRKSPGTLLWIPRSLAEHLTVRAKKTKNGFEAAALGAMTVVMELPFTISLFAVACVFATHLTSDLQVYALISYGVFTILPLLIITILIGAGHRLSAIQRWRETNKQFLQYTSSFGLLAVTFFIILYFVMGSA